jgi:MFS family permease
MGPTDVSPLIGAWRDYRDAARRFSPPARRLLAAEFLMWCGYGVSQVLFNLYLVESGFGPRVVGHAISLFGVGVAIAALPAGWIANRLGRSRTLQLGVLVDGLGQLLRCLWPAAGLVYTASLITGAGQSLIQIPSAPYMTEHSTPRERTHLFSTLFALSLFAGVLGTLFGGWLPRLLVALPGGFPGGLAGAYRASLVLGALVSLSGSLVLAGLPQDAAPDPARLAAPPTPEMKRRLVPIGVNALLIGAGAGLVIPFMNLYFSQRFQCSSAQIGSFFSAAQVLTAIASLLAPALAWRFGKLRTALCAQLLSLPFLVTLGIEHRLEVAVGAFWIRATLMQAVTPLLGTFVMEALPSELRATATGLINLLWNVGWALSATLAGGVIQQFGYEVPFYATASLYAAAALYFYASFRGTPEPHSRTKVPEESPVSPIDGP